jgi:hypothetical protein
VAEPDRTRPLLEGLSDEVRALGSELRESLVLRWRLALLELRADYHSTVRLAIGASAAGVMALSALPLLLVWLAGRLDQWLGVSRDGWLLIFGLALLAAGVASGYLAWRRFRRRFLGLEQTLEELREDAAWLRQWAGGRR